MIRRAFPTLTLSLLLAALLTATGPVAWGAAKSEKSEDGKWVSLFDGKTLEGWKQKNGTANYVVKNGAIVGSTTPNSPNSFLCSTKNYGDFVLTFETKVLRNNLNSGCQIRSHSTSDYRNGRVHGPQVEIEFSPGQAGFIYGEATTGAWISPHAGEKTTKAFKNDQWNTYRIRAVGPRVQVWINGQKITDVTNAKDLNADNPGFIALQVHHYVGKHPAKVKWRNIRIQVLDDSAEAK